MGSLQSCPRCGAQFDISTFAPGQRFTCGSCETVLTAGAPGGGERRAPQNRPPLRRREGKRAAAPHQAPGASRGHRSGGRARRGGSERPAKGVSPALLYGGGALVVAAILLLLFAWGGGDDDVTTGAGGSNGARSAGPSTEPVQALDTVASLRSELRGTSLTRASDYRTWAKRFLAVGGDDAESEARRLYTELIEQDDPDDRVARKYLGYTDFQVDILENVLEPNGDPIPEEISNRSGYDFLDAVVEFSTPAHRWMMDENEIELARKAVADMRQHAKKLRADRVYRAGDSIRGIIANDPILRELNYETIWQAPYLICYSSSESLSDFELLKLPYQERKAKRAALAEKRKAWKRILDEKAAIFKGAYDEWMKRYAEPWQLKPLTDEYGGRPNFREGVRSYRDGVPLCIWIFTIRRFRSITPSTRVDPCATAWPGTSCRPRDGSSSSTTRRRPRSGSSRSTSRCTRASTNSSTGSRGSATSGERPSWGRTRSPRALPSTSARSRWTSIAS